MMGLSGMHHRRRREACGERGAEFGIAVWRRSLESFPREVGAKAQRGRDWASSPQRIPNCGGRGRRDPAGIWRTVAPTTTGDTLAFSSIPSVA